MEISWFMVVHYCKSFSNGYVMPLNFKIKKDQSRKFEGVDANFMVYGCALFQEF
jgi:hypothetical protein